MRSTLSASLTLSLCPVSVSKLRIQRFESSCSTLVSTWRTTVWACYPCGPVQPHDFWMNMQFLSPLVIGLELYIYMVNIEMHAFREVDKLDRSIGNTYSWSVPCEWTIGRSIYHLSVHLSVYISVDPSMLYLYLLIYIIIYFYSDTTIYLNT